MKVRIIHYKYECDNCGKCVKYLPKLFTIKNGEVVLKNGVYENNIGIAEVDITLEELRRLYEVCHKLAIDIELE